MIEFPRYTRDENLVCKLNDADIEYIRYRYKKGDSRKKLMEIFDVSYTTISRWTDEDYRQRQLAKVRSYKRKLPSEYRRNANRKWKLRKIKIRPEYKKWRSQAEMRCPYRKTKRWKKLHVERVLKSRRKGKII